MKLRNCAVLLLAALMLFLLAGCAAHGLDERLDVAEEAVENRVDAAEDAAEAAIRQVITPDPMPQQTSPPVQVPAATQPPAAADAPPESVPAALTADEAESIALTHSGFTADQVNYLWTEYEIDDGIPQFDVQFHEGYWEYEYEIHAETGQILSFDKDD